MGYRGSRTKGRVSPPVTRRSRFDDDMGRLCRCGHAYGAHGPGLPPTSGRPHTCEEGCFCGKFVEHAEPLLLGGGGDRRKVAEALGALAEAMAERRYAEVGGVWTRETAVATMKAEVLRDFARLTWTTRSRLGEVWILWSELW